MKKENFTQKIPGSDIRFDLIFVPGGKFKMGSQKDDPNKPNYDPDAYDDEGPVHEVNVPDFFIGKFPVTQDVWTEIMGGNPSFFEGDRRPVEQVSWNDIVLGDPEKGIPSFLEALKKRTGLPFRLPTEAEWEFAARGGDASSMTKYAGSDKLKEVGWFYENSHGETKPVGLLEPNELGIHDMSGNVWEWCEDDWHGSYKENPPGDGSAWIDKPERGGYRVVRGGSWYPVGIGARACRSADRIDVRPGRRWYFYGFRLVLSPQSVG